MRSRTTTLIGLAALAAALAVVPVVASRSTASSPGSARLLVATGAEARPSPAAPASALPVAPAGPVGPVAVLGDSITEEPESWFRQLCRTAASAASGLAGTCLNAGVSGNTTLQMAERLERDVLAANPSTIVVMGGTNDLRRGTSVTQIVDRLRAIVDAATAAGVPVVLSTVTPQNRYGAKVVELNREIRAYAGEAGIPLLDVYPWVGTERGTFTAGASEDGLHPTTAGYAAMAIAARAQLPTLIDRAQLQQRPLTG